MKTQLLYIMYVSYRLREINDFDFDWFDTQAIPTPGITGKATPAKAPGSPDPKLQQYIEAAPLAAIECAISTCAAHPCSDTFCIFILSQKVLAITVLQIFCVRKKCKKICCVALLCKGCPATCGLIKKKWRRYTGRADTGKLYKATHI